MRQFGTVRGARKKEMVLKEFLFNGANFIRESLEDMKERTARKKGSKSGKTKKSKGNNAKVMSKPADIDVGDAEGNSNELQKPVLTELEQQINETSVLHDMTKVCGLGEKFDSRIAVCEHCHRRLLKGVLDVHMHETHSGKNTCLVVE